MPDPIVQNAICLLKNGGSAWESNPPVARLTHDTAILKTVATIPQPADSITTCDDAAERLGVLLGALGAKFDGLPAVVKAWPALPEAIRRAILAMVEVVR